MADDALTPAARLRKQLEQAVRAGRSKGFLLPQLERLVAMSAEGSDDWRFANRQLAELLLEQAPWRAALHARRVAHLAPHDDAAHALLALALALQHNYKAAIASYRRALSASPGNPWYTHNIGHLYDVALDQPREGLPFLRAAHREEPEQPEVASSLAHCLARTGLLDEARALSSTLVARWPERAEFDELHRWITGGAKERLDQGSPALLAQTAHPEPAPSLHGSSTDEAERAERRAPDDEHIASLLAGAALTEDQRARARRLWNDYETRARPVIGSARVLAAAIEYTIHRVDGTDRTQRAIADRYKVSISAVRSRYAAIRATLAPEIAVGRYHR